MDTLTDSTMVKTSGGSQPQLRVMTYNILAPVWTNKDWYPGVSADALDWKERQTIVYGVIRSQAPHIVCLQEVQDYESLRQAFSADYEISNFSTNDPTEAKDDKGRPIPNGTVTMVKRDVCTRTTSITQVWIPPTKQKADGKTVSADDGVGTAGTVLHATLNIPSGENADTTVAVVNCHLDFDKTLAITKKQWDEAASTLFELSADVLIACGDMNVAAANMRSLVLMSKGRELTDAFGWSDDVKTWFGAKDEPKRTDYILFSGKNVRVSAASTGFPGGVRDVRRTILNTAGMTPAQLCELNLRYNGSDHCPLLASLDLF